MDLKLDPITGDLAFEDGDLVLVDGVDAIVQHIRIRFKFFKGEWYQDTREGTPWYEEILGHKPTQRRANEIARSVLASTPGVASVDSVQVTLDDATRDLSISFIAHTTDGAVINSADFAPFIVET